MRRGIAVGLLACISLTVTGCGGCGGGMTAAYMRAHAIRRPKDDEKPGVPNPNANKPVSNSKSDTAARPTPARPTPAQPAPVKPTPSQPNPSATVPPAVAANQTPAPAVPAPANAAQTTRPKTLAERRARAIRNMAALGAGIERYAQAKGVYPTPSINAAGTKAPLLSWRVELLPYLGLLDLYQQFHVNEPWDSPHNKQLLSQIPEVYQSPERFDEKTNYLLAVGGAAAFRPRQTRGFAPREFEDGVENTILLVEVSDDLAVPWTRPEDFDVTRGNVADLLGKLRSDGLFVLWGGGRVGLLANGTDARLLSTFLTIDGGDNTVAAATISYPPTAEPQAKGSEPESTAVAAKPDGPPAAADPGTAAVVDPRAPAPPVVGAAPAAATHAEPLAPVPGAPQQKAAKRTFDEIWGKYVAAARSEEEKQALAKNLLEQFLPKVQDDLPGQYVLLGEVYRLAVQGDDAVTALNAVESLCSRFDVDATTLRVSALEKFSGSTSTQTPAANQLVLKYAYNLVSQALEEDNFEAADRMYDIAVAAARRTRRQDLIRALQRKKQEIEVAETAYREVRRVLAELGSGTASPEANLTVGNYYCFVKGNWAKGLPLLARSSDEALRGLAEVELDPPALAERQIELADGWWSLGAEQAVPLRRRMQLRAVSWYQKALPQLAEGLQKVKVEVRLQEAQRTYGKAAVPPATTGAALAGPRGAASP